MLPDNFLPLFLLHGGLFVKNKDANVASTVECMSVCVCVCVLSINILVYGAWMEGWVMMYHQRTLEGDVKILYCDDGGSFTTVCTLDVTL